MAENKKSFVAYCDWLEVFENLSDEEAGKLTKHLFKYVNDLNPKSDRTTELLFIQIKQCLKRDLNKYKEFIDKQRVNGKKGGRPKKTQKTQAFSEKPKKADNDNDSVNVNVNDKEKYIKAFEIFWDKYPVKVAKKKCEEKFLRLSQQDINKILSTLDEYIAYKPFKEYRHANPLTYINQERWNDEVKPKEVKPKFVYKP